MKRTQSDNQNIELGKVSWYRDYDQALKLSQSSNKPILLFFQEIPGCHTCVNYGREVLSHPLMVECIENVFVPLAIYNNKPGRDAEILRKYNEPAWNNPVAHFIDASGNDIIPKLANNYHPLSMYYKMAETLLRTKGSIPEYFRLFEDDLKIIYGASAVTYYETPCFWSGETTMAEHPSVMATEAGWIGHKEVVEIHYNPEEVSLAQLNDFALKQGFFLTDKHEIYRTDKNPQYYVKNSPLRKIPMTPVQRTRVNRAIPYQENPLNYLSPKQKAWAENVDRLEVPDLDIYHMPITKSWPIADKTKLILH